eukprot:6471289-Amphidinium_carterae.2
MHWQRVSGPSTLVFSHLPVEYATPRLLVEHHEFSIEYIFVVVMSWFKQASIMVAALKKRLDKPVAAVFLERSGFELAVHSFPIAVAVLEQVELE